jgi:hypothetical protein
MEPTHLVCTTRLEADLKTNDGKSKTHKPGSFTFKTHEVSSIAFSVKDSNRKTIQVAKLYPDSGLHGKLLEHISKESKTPKGSQIWSISSDERSFWILRGPDSVNSELVVCRSKI